MMPDKWPTLDRLVADFGSQADRLSLELQQTTSKLGLFESLKRYLGAGQPFHVLDLLERESKLLASLRSTDPEVEALLQEIASTSRTQAGDILFRYPALLDAACTDQGLVLDITSRHPNYSFGEGFLMLSIDEGKRKANVHTQERRLAEIPADISAVVAAAKREMARLFERPFDGPGLLTSLFKAYEQAVKRAKLPAGDWRPFSASSR